MKNVLLLFILTLGFRAQATDTPGVTVGLKNFRSIYYSLSAVTGVRPTPDIIEKYKSIQSRLPKEGRVDEMSNQVLLAVKDLAGMFCKEFSKTYQDPSKASGNMDDLLKDLSARIYGRTLSIGEAQKLNLLLNSLSQQISRPFVACTAMTSSIEFLVLK